MTKNTLWALIIGLVIGLVIGIIALLCQKSHFLGEIRALKPKVEEIYIRDTITLLKPIEITRRVKDTIYVPIRDTLRLRDTTFVVLAKEEKVYQDTNYRAIVSGYEPCLEEIEVYPATKIVYNTTTQYKKQKFGLGVSLGYGATINNNQVILRPYLGVSLNYNFLSF